MLETSRGFLDQSAKLYRRHLLFINQRFRADKLFEFFSNAPRDQLRELPLFLLIRFLPNSLPKRFKVHLNGGIGEIVRSVRIIEGLIELLALSEAVAIIKLFLSELLNEALGGDVVFTTSFGMRPVD